MFADPGVAVRPVCFTPAFSKRAGVHGGSVQIHDVLGGTYQVRLAIDANVGVRPILDRLESDSGAFEASRASSLLYSLHLVGWSTTPSQPKE